MSEATLLLRAAQRGDAAAADQLACLLYRDLQRLAHSRLRASGPMTLLDTRALVHEVWLRIACGGDGQSFPDHIHFLAYASRVMRSVVVDLVRARQAERRGGDLQFVTLSTILGEQLSNAHREAEVLKVHEALDELARLDERLAQVVEMRYFAGLGERDIAAALGVTERTVQRSWAKARVLLSQTLRA